jgi:hypothetical protein
LYFLSVILNIISSFFLAMEKKLNLRNFYVKLGFRACYIKIKEQLNLPKLKLTPESH